MSLVTLRISLKDEARVYYSMLSLDPHVRMPKEHLEVELPNPFRQILIHAKNSIEVCLMTNNVIELERLGSYFASIIMPSELISLLAKTTDTYLYLDLDLDLVEFPWHCLKIGDKFLGSKFIVGRHIRMSDDDKVSLNVAPSKYLIISNPDGTLPQDAAEGESLREIFKANVSVDLLTRKVSRAEARDAISSADVFHFCGHSSSDGLQMSDGMITSVDVKSFRLVPRFVFLNSCNSGHFGNGESVPIVRAFLERGTRALLATTTPMRSADAAIFADHFYKHLQVSSLGESMKYALSSSDDNLLWAKLIFFGHPQYSIAFKQPRYWIRNFAAATALMSLIAVLCFTYYMVERGSKNVISNLDSESCRSGQSESCLKIGRDLILNGQFDLGMDHLSKSCDQKMVASCIEMGIQKVKTGQRIDLSMMAFQFCLNGTYPGCVDLGFELKDAGQSESAFAIFKSFCDQGDSLSCVGAASILDQTGDTSNAKNYSSRACELGSKLGCVRYAIGLTKSGQQKSGIKLLRKYCRDRVIPGACTDLAAVLISEGNTNEAIRLFELECNGDGENNAISCELAGVSLRGSNRLLAKNFFSRACDLGRMSACAIESGMFESDLGPCGNLDSNDCYSLGYRFQTTGDLERADKIYRHLCNHEFPQVCNDVGVVAKLRGDISGAKKIFDRSCGGGVANACYNLGTALMDEKLIDLALIKFVTACDLGNGSGCAQAADLYRSIGDKQNTLRYFESGCRNRDATSCNNWGSLQGDLKSYSDMKSGYQQSCALGLSLGCRNLALVLQNEKDELGASEVLSKSCDKGDVLSCDQLQNIIRGRELSH
jgi:TPR repeat protein